MVRQTFLNNKYCRVSKIILTIIAGLILISCSPQINVLVKKSYPSREDNDSVVIYKKAQDIPIESEKIGTLRATCNPYLNNCDSASIFSLAKTKIKKAGGNALLLTNFEKPTFWNPILLSNGSVFSLSGDVFLVHDFSSPHDIARSIAKLDLYGGVGFGPETGISLPKISIYNFQNRKNFETYYGAEAGIWGFVAFLISLDCLYGIKKNIFTMDTSLGAFWAIPPDGTQYYFHTTINPKIGIKFWKLWLKTGPAIHLYRSDSAVGSFGKIGNMYYNFEILIQF